MPPKTSRLGGAPNLQNTKICLVSSRLNFIHLTEGSVLDPYYDIFYDLCYVQAIVAYFKALSKGLPGGKKV
jgi:hypothetical protein